MDILSVNKLALDLVARDFSDGHTPTNAGPTKTSRALAIIHLAARDAYAMVTSAFAPRLVGLPIPPSGLGNDDATGSAAVLGAGIRAAVLLYPDDASYIAEQETILLSGANPTAVYYGYQIADAWVMSRQSDGSDKPQLDSLYDPNPGHHRPDPLDPTQQTLGREWGNVTPFVLGDVATDAPLGHQPALNSQAYADAFDDVFVN